MVQTSVSQKKLKKGVFYLFLVIFCGFGLYLAVFRLLCSSKPFFSTLDNQDLQKYHERDEEKALNSMIKAKMTKNGQKWLIVGPTS